MEFVVNRSLFIWSWRRHVEDRLFHCLRPTNTPSLPQTARVSRASSSRPAPTTASAPVSSVPVTGNQNANVAALLQLLSSAGGMPALPQMPTNGADMSHLFSALAGVYNFGLSNQPAAAQPQHPASNPASRPLPKERVSHQTEDVVIVKEEEEEIQEIECMPSTSTAPPVRPTPIAATRPTSATHAVKPPAAPTALPKPSTQLAQPAQLPSTLVAAGARPRKSSGQAAAQPTGDKENLPPGTVSLAKPFKKDAFSSFFPE